jgi:hypothetical protein
MTVLRTSWNAALQTNQSEGCSNGGIPVPARPAPAVGWPNGGGARRRGGRCDVATEEGSAELELGGELGEGDGGTDQRWAIGEAMRRQREGQWALSKLELGGGGVLWWVGDRVAHSTSVLLHDPHLSRYFILFLYFCRSILYEWRTHRCLGCDTGGSS